MDSRAPMMRGPSPRPPAQGRPAPVRPIGTQNVRPVSGAPGAQTARPMAGAAPGSARPQGIVNSRSPQPQFPRSPRPTTAPLPPRSPRPPASNVRPGVNAPNAPRSPRPPSAPMPPRSPRPPSRSPAPTGVSRGALNGAVRPAAGTGAMPVAPNGAAANPAIATESNGAATQSAVRPPMGPARSKRAARAYHQDATQPASSGWNDVTARPAPSQAAWQQQQAHQQQDSAMQGPYIPSGGMQSDDRALDQIPGQRNAISQSQLAANRAAMSGRPGGMPPNASQAAGMPSAPPGAGGAPGMPAAQSTPVSGMGAPDAGARPKIDPDQIPSPVDAQYADQRFFHHEFFGTCSREGLPLSTTNFAAIDQGNCSPKFMRLTTYCVPATEEVAATSKLPMALTVQPFAQLRPDEAPVPLAQLGEAGPPRCKRCRAYINPWCLFVEGGMKWICSLCGNATEVAQDYFCNLNISGRRVDLAVRPELTSGSVDFPVPMEYWAVQTSLDVSNMLPIPNATWSASTTQLTTSSQMLEKVDQLTDQLADQTVDPAAKTAARAAKAAGEAALGTLNLGKGHATVRTPRPLTYLFVIDVSFSAVRCGALQVTCQAIREALYGPNETDREKAHEHSPGFGVPPGSRVGFITFDQALHFYSLDPELDQAQMMVMADINDPFIPISSGLLVDPWTSRTVIENLLRDLPGNFANTSSSEAALGAALRAAQAALSTIGGQLNVFLSTIPTIGPGKLKHREDTKLYGTDSEKNLFGVQDAFYRQIGEEFALAGVGINTFFFPSQYIDVATIGHMTAETGGEVFFHPRFDPVRDGSRVVAEVQRAILRETAYNATMRIRCSSNLKVVKHYGNFHPHSLTDLELGTWDADKALTALVKHDGKLDESQEAYFQCAVLYTTATGERRVRVHTMGVPVTNSLGNVFRYADMDSAVSFYAKEAATLAHSKSLKDVRSYLTTKCVAILTAYRRNCASSTSAGQLILPESFKLFPLYVLALMKNKAIKGGNVTSDVRVYFIRLLLGLSVGSIMALLYPRMVALHRLAPTDGEPVTPRVDVSAEKQAEEDALMKVIACPHLMRPSFARMDSHGAYLLENGEWCLLWLGAQVSPKFLEDLYGVSSLDELDPRMTSLPNLPSKLSKQVRNLIASFAAQRCKPTLQVIIARQNRDGSKLYLDAQLTTVEVELANNLVEDQNNDAMSYVDYVRTTKLIAAVLCPSCHLFRPKLCEA
ncbi:COPII coat Sec23p-Sfb3p heterodimer component [Malassezia yamatoensis]|uniref:COPII coat Sec23p-Sfb3p heterodimer component n=1 Tax=Malassezia yamatoensis TaxID=253288 RepID=A0AAJ6CI07_9BASI|nr:COPII coat Sec23p-Sfb3p heterodimer component [Malassezia yamatoensis]